MWYNIRKLIGLSAFKPIRGEMPGAWYRFVVLLTKNNGVGQYLHYISADGVDRYIHDIRMTSYERERLKWPKTQLLVEQTIRADDKAIVKVRITGPLWGKTAGLQGQERGAILRQNDLKTFKHIRSDSACHAIFDDNPAITIWVIRLDSLA